MTSTMTKILAASTIALGLSAGVVFAGPVDDVIKARQACMKARGGAMKVFVPISKGEAAFDAAAVAKAIADVEAACANGATFFAAGTEKGETVETWAKAEIWTDTEGWKTAAQAGGAAHAAVKAAADEASFKTAFGQYGASCKGCHEKFRRPKE